MGLECDQQTISEVYIGIVQKESFSLMGLDIQALQVTTFLTLGALLQIHLVVEMFRE